MASPAGRVAVITGASRGLGAGLADHFASQGIALGLCARTRPDGPDGVAGSLCRSVDVTDPAAVDTFCAEVAAELGPIDLWVNDAGVLEPIGPLRDADPFDVARHLDVNVGGVLHGSQAFVRHRRAVAAAGGDGGGVLVNISSGAARSPYAGWGPYCAAKAAVDALTGCIALEEAEIGLRAHAVAPGVIDTDMQALIRATPADRFPAVDRFLALKEAEAFSTPAHVAAWLLALAFDPAAATTEVVLRVPTMPNR